ncbi:MAG TPA: M28 family peptidase [Tenuifilaceae bacterium]|nr:M28 family peptidase [Tenuifilaceae bacterium]
MKYFTAALALILLSCNFSDDCTQAEYTISYSDIEQDIQVLSADSLEGRAPLTMGEKRTLAYLTSRMQAIGLTPAFNGNYLQPVPLVGIVSNSSDRMKISTPSGNLALKCSDDFTAWTPSLTESVKVNGCELVFAGYGIDAPEWTWNDFSEADVKGKIIVVLVNDPGFHSGNGSLFNGLAMTYYGRWTYKFEQAERMGAKGCFIVHEDKAAGYPWAIVNRKVGQKSFYLDGDQLKDRHCLINGWLTLQAAKDLFAMCNMDYEDMKVKASTPGFKAIPMKAKLNLSIENSWERSVSYNVGGFIAGSERPDEAIVYTAHWDHLGIGVPVDGDSIYNGASDNAAAVAWMLSIAKAFKSLKQPPHRSVLFLTPTCEESNLLGSQYYVDNPTFAHEKIAACFNSDVIMFLGSFNDVTITGMGHSELDSLLEIEASKQGRYICNDPNPENGMFYRSDQLPFLKAGIPSLFAKGYSHQVELGREKTLQVVDEYWKTTYHKPCDEYYPDRHNLQGLVDDTKLFFRLGYNLANSTYFPKWSEGSEFFVER